MDKNFSENDIKALKFRDELISLCKKYDCDITGSYRDDGNMSLQIFNKELNWSSYYIMNPHDNYNLREEDEDFNLIHIMDKYIMNEFDREPSEMAGLNNIKVNCGVITDDYEKARLKFQELQSKYGDEEIERFIIGKDYMELRLTNGKRYVWVKPCMRVRGYRFANIIIDRNIEFNILNNAIIPICYACGKDNVEIF